MPILAWAELWAVQKSSKLVWVRDESSEPNRGECSRIGNGVAQQEAILTIACKAQNINNCYVVGTVFENTGGHMFLKNNLIYYRCLKRGKSWIMNIGWNTFEK